MGFQITFKYQPCRKRCHILLQISLKRSCAILRIICPVADKLFCFCRKAQAKFLILHKLVDFLNLNINDIRDVVLRKRLEHDDFIQSVQKLRSEVVSQIAHNEVARTFRDFAVFVYAVKQEGRTDIRCHDQYRVFKINRSALRIGDPAVV